MMAPNTAVSSSSKGCSVGGSKYAQSGLMKNMSGFTLHEENIERAFSAACDWLLVEANNTEHFTRGFMLEKAFLKNTRNLAYN
jgi:hypothetical protein